MASLDTIRRLKVVATTEGTQQAAAALKGIADAQRAVGNASAATSAVSETSSRRTLDVSRAFERLRVTLDPAARALQSFERNQRIINQALDQGADKAQAYALSVANMQRLQTAGTPTGHFDQTAINGLLGVNDNVSNSARVSAEAFDEAYREMDRMEAAAAKLKAQLDPLAAAQDRFNAELSEYRAMAASGLITTNELAGATALAQAKLGAMESAARKLGAATKLSAGQMSGMAYQFQDIGVSLAGGQSPFNVLLAQGGQLVQMFAPGTGLRGAIAALGSGIMSFLTNPLNLAVVGVAALAGAIPMIWRAITGGSVNAEEAMKRHVKIVDQVREAYKRARDGTEEWSKAVKDLTFLQAQKNFQDMKKLADEARKALAVSIPSQTTMVGGGKGGIATVKTNPLIIEMAQLSNQAAKGTVTFDQFIRRLDDIGRSTSDQKIQNLALKHQENALNASKAAQAMAEAQTVMDALGKGAAAAAGLVNNLAGSLGTAAGAAATYEAAMESLGSKIPEIAKQVQINKDLAAAKTDLDTSINAASQMGGSPLDKHQATQAAIDRYNRQKEAILGVLDVRKKIDDYENTARIGLLSPRAQAIARENEEYRKLQESMQGNGTPQAEVARAAAAHAQALANINAQYDIKDAKAAGRDNVYKTAIENIQQETAMMLKEADAINLTAQERDKALAVEKLQLAAKEAQIALTPTLISQINAEAEAYAAAQQKLREAQEAQQRFEEYRQIGQEAFSSFISDIRQGVSALDALKNSLDRVADRLLDMAINGAFDMLFKGLQGGMGGGFGGGIGSIFSSIFGGGGSNFGGNGASFANGGIMTHHGALPLNMYASGGIANTPQMAIFGEGRRPEAFVPLPDGRSIPVTMNMPEPANMNMPVMPNMNMYIPKAQPANVSVQVNNAPAGTEVGSVKTQQGADGNLEVVIDMLSKKLKSEIAQDFANGGQLASTLQQRYVLKKNIA